MLTHFMTEQAKHAGVDFRQAVKVTDVDLIRQDYSRGRVRDHLAKKIIMPPVRPTVS